MYTRQRSARYLVTMRIELREAQGWTEPARRRTVRAPLESVSLCTRFSGFSLPYDVGPARGFLGEAEKTPWLCVVVWFCGFVHFVVVLWWFCVVLPLAARPASRVKFFDDI